MFAKACLVVGWGVAWSADGGTALFPRFSQLESLARGPTVPPASAPPIATAAPVPPAKPQNPIQASQATLPVPEAATGADRSHPPTCDVSFEGTLCFNDGQSVIVPPARHYGLVLHLDMEGSRPIDVSGMGHHAAGDLYSAPGLTGVGHSALFRGSFVDVPPSPVVDNIGVGNFSVTFFISVLEDAVTIASRAPLEADVLWCPIIHKGHETVDPPSVVAMPAVMIDVKTRQLKVVLSTEHLPSPMQGEFLTSNSRLLPKRTYHIAVVRFEQRLRLYVNGILDSTIQTLGCNKPNSEPLFVGGAAWSKEMCDAPMLLDEVKLYSVALGRDYIQAEASNTLNGTEPDFCLISCVNCTMQEAAEGCPEGYHLCSRLEWLTDVYGVARALGLLGKGVKIHTGDAPPEEKTLVEPKEGEPTTAGLGVGFCCRDLSP